MTNSTTPRQSLLESTNPPYRTYREYLNHPTFLQVRAQVMRRANGCCEWCKAKPAVEVHHLRYPKWGAFDVPENLVAVCHACHCAIHGKEN